MAIVRQVLQAARAKIESAGTRCPTEDAGRRQQPLHGPVQKPLPWDGAVSGEAGRKLGGLHGLCPGGSLGLSIDQAAASEGTAAVKPVEIELFNPHLL